MVDMIPRPHALLLDFGGVLVDAPPQDPAPVGLVERLHDLVGGVVPAERIARDLVTGARDYASWRDRVSAEDRPADLTHERVWDDFVAARWPRAARAAMRREATALSYTWTRRPEWAVVAGIPELLATAAGAGIPMAIVSNTLCGAAHRDFLAEVGLAERFAAQYYSDEAGVRKPNPELAWRAAQALGVPIGQCWFVGDSLIRDVACARRAGAGAAVLLRSPRTDRERPPAGIAPDATVDDGHGARDLLTASLSGAAS
jgi:HAD superfamily hydrolase (TIGR01549 family)